jgi:hypothetical protein
MTFKREEKKETNEEWKSGRAKEALDAGGGQREE